MHFRSLSLALTGCLCLSAPAFAEDAPAPAGEAHVEASEESTPASIVKAFFLRLGKGQIEEAYDELLTGTRIAETPTDVLMLKKKTRDAMELVGGIRGAELLDKKAPSSHLYSLSYVSLGAEYPLQWRFYFYKRTSGWKLIDIRISDRLPELFGEKTEAQ